MNPNAKVMVVDDAAAVRGMLRALLNGEGYRVVGDLASGAQVMTAIEQLDPAIVCLDYNLPDIDGLELLKQIHAAHPTVAVVIITGSIDPALDDAVAEAGASGLIRKPFSPDTILREIFQVAHAQQLLVAATASGMNTLESPRAKAVIADGSSIMRMLLAAILAKMEIEVVGEACDGKQAVEMVAAHRPDLVFLDLHMPIMSGLEALVAIRARDPDARVMMVSGRSDRDAILRAGNAGAGGYILKPYQPAKVIAAIAKLLS